MEAGIQTDRNKDASSCQPFVTVLLPVRNEEEVIVQRIDEFLSQTYPADLRELLIIDGRSTDGTVSRAENYVANSACAVRVLDNPTLHVSQALNQGIQQARGTVIIRWDGHTSFDTTYIATCVRTLEETSAWNVGGPARTLASTTMQEAIRRVYHSPFAVGGARFHRIDYTGAADTVPYGCWKKETLEALGGFDEDLIRNQDDELNLRIIRSGGTVYQSSEIISWYSPRATLRALYRQYFQYGYWKVHVIRKHRIPASFRHLVPALFLAGLSLGACMSVLIPSIRDTYILVIGIYVLAVLIASLQAARGGWRLLLRMLLIFPTFHISYGSGFLFAFLRLALGRGSVVHTRHSSALTR